MGYKVNININLDRYKSEMFPDLPVIPQIGSFVSTKKEYTDHFMKNGYPCVLEVKSIVHHENHCVVDLWYSQTQSAVLKAKNKEF